MKIPTREHFTAEAKFYIKEFDVPLVQTEDGIWFNWYGGRPMKYDSSFLKPGNNWKAESFEEWLEVLKSSVE